MISVLTPRQAVEAQVRGLIRGATIEPEGLEGNEEAVRAEDVNTGPVTRREAEGSHAVAHAGGVEIFATRVESTSAKKARAILEQAMDTVTAAHAFIAEETEWGGVSPAEVSALLGERTPEVEAHLHAAVNRLLALPKPEYRMDATLDDQLACIEAVAGLHCAAQFAARIRHRVPLADQIVARFQAFLTPADVANIAHELFANNEPLGANVALRLLLRCITKEDGEYAHFEQFERETAALALLKGGGSYLAATVLQLEPAQKKVLTDAWAEAALDPRKLAATAALLEPEAHPWLHPMLEYWGRNASDDLGFMPVEQAQLSWRERVTVGEAILPSRLKDALAAVSPEDVELLAGLIHWQDCEAEAFRRETRARDQLARMTGVLRRLTAESERPSGPLGEIPGFPGPEGAGEVSAPEGLGDVEEELDDVAEAILNRYDTLLEEYRQGLVDRMQAVGVLGRYREAIDQSATCKTALAEVHPFREKLLATAPADEATRRAVVAVLLSAGFLELPHDAREVWRALDEVSRLGGIEHFAAISKVHFEGKNHGQYVTAERLMRAMEVQQGLEELRQTIFHEPVHPEELNGPDAMVRAPKEWLQAKKLEHPGEALVAQFPDPESLAEYPDSAQRLGHRNPTELLTYAAEAFRSDPALLRNLAFSQVSREQTLIRLATYRPRGFESR